MFNAICGLLVEPVGKNALHLFYVLHSACGKLYAPCAKGLSAMPVMCAIKAAVSKTFAGVSFAEKGTCALEAAAFPLGNAHSACRAKEGFGRNSMEKQRCLQL